MRESGGGEASLGTGDASCCTSSRSRAPSPPTATAGLYHFALLVPERATSRAWLAHAARDRVGLTGMSDHFVSEALYLRDPDGHGIEIYWDRPRSVWEGQVGERMTTLPLDVDAILNESTTGAARLRRPPGGP